MSEFISNLSETNYFEMWGYPIKDIFTKDLKLTLLNFIL